eukprot:1340482-Rhodomonas_salina.1
MRTELELVLLARIADLKSSPPPILPLLPLSSLASFSSPSPFSPPYPPYPPDPPSPPSPPSLSALSPAPLCPPDAVSGTDGGVSYRARYAVSSTELPRGAIPLRPPYAIPGADLASIELGARTRRDAAARIRKVNAHKKKNSGTPVGSAATPQNKTQAKAQSQHALFRKFLGVSLTWPRGRSEEDAEDYESMAHPSQDS